MLYYYNTTTELICQQCFTETELVSSCDSGHCVNGTYRVAPEGSHYQESSLNRTKNHPCSYISHQF